MTPASSGDRDVLPSLPRTRPTRRSAKRGEPVSPSSGARTGDGVAGEPPTRHPALKPKKPVKPKPDAAATAKATARQKRAATPSATPKPKASPAQARRAKPTPTNALTSPTPSEPRASKTPPAAGWATPAERERPSGAELVGTAIQAIGELAQIGLTFGGQALVQALRRLPRP